MTRNDLEELHWRGGDRATDEHEDLLPRVYGSLGLAAFAVFLIIVLLGIAS